MEENTPKVPNQFTVMEYLSESQIEIAKQRVQSSATMADNMAVLTLIDSFVRANGKANVEYETIFSLLQSTMTATSDIMAYPQRVKENLPLVFLFAYYDYLILTGVMSEDDISRLQAEASRYMMNGGPAKA